MKKPLACLAGVALAGSALAALKPGAPFIDNTPSRVETPLRVGLRQVGTLRPKAVGEVSARRWTIDCATMDREQVDWRTVREYIAPLGIARMRQQAGWARCEKDPGRYEFSWLDQAVLDAKRRGIDTWLELSYGNPAYPGGGGRHLSAGFPTSPEGLAAWDRWVEKIVTHYKGVVKDYCIWNEPDNRGSGNTSGFATDFAIRTAEIIRRVEPDATIAAFALSHANVAFVEPFVKELEKRGKAHLFTTIAYHHYSMNPDNDYEQVEACRRLIARHVPNLKLWQGEGGTWSEWGGSGALSAHGWTELTQAKYDLRRSLGDLGHGDDTEVFHICDMEYRTSGFHDGLVRYGLLKTAGQAEGFRLLKVKMAYYAIQNAVSVFNDDFEALGPASTSQVKGLDRGVAYDWRHRATGLSAVVFWESAYEPSDRCETRTVELRVKGRPFTSPVWCDLLTGHVYEIAARNVRVDGDRTVYTVPAYDAPTFVTDRSLLTLDESWFVRATGGWGPLLENGMQVKKVRFYGPFPKATAAKTSAELAKLGEARELTCDAQGEFNFEPLCPAPLQRRMEPDYAGFVVFEIDSEKGGEATLWERNDWYGQFFVNGESVGGALCGKPGAWTRIRTVLKPGKNEVVFRTSPGSAARWLAAFGVE